MKKNSSYSYSIVDVFTNRPLEGNPLAVFPDAAGIDDITMQKIARELNLSETAFIVPADRKDCIAGVRIFTPNNEMIFAGHPTIGTSYVLIKKGIIHENIEHFILEEKVGPVPIRVDMGKRPLIWLCTPRIKEELFFDRLDCAKALGLDFRDLLDINPQLLNAGNPTIFVAVKNKEAVDCALLNISEYIKFKEKYPSPLCVFIFAPTHEGAYSRMFAPDYGIIEDPATGSSTGPLAAYMMKTGLIPVRSGTRFISEQGTKMGRRSILHVFIEGEQGRDGIYVGGNAVSVAEGLMTI